MLPLVLLPSLPLHLRTAALFFVLISTSGLYAQAVSSRVYFDSDSVLRYQADAENNYIPDYSHAGYHNGEAPLPDVPTVLTIGPIEGDATAHVQAALDQLAARTPDANGYRGALLLEPGVYDISGQLFLRESGMVLRGSGQGATPQDNTILRGLGNTLDKRALVVVRRSGGAPSWRTPVPGTRSVVTSPFVPAGSRTLEVSFVEAYQAGDNVIVYHPSTESWLASIDFGATNTDAPWEAGDLDMFYNRYVTAVNIPEGKITLDAPIYDHLESALAQSQVYLINTDRLVRESGVEHLRIDVVTEGALAENHVRTAIFLNGVEDCWVSNVTALNFSFALVDMSTASRVTVTDCEGLSPHSPISGGWRYNFNVSALTNNILFRNNHASQGRHSFVSNGASSAAGIVFTNCTSDEDYSSSEGHRRWSQGLLFDKITFTNSETTNLLNLYNRGDFGTGHGWSSVSSTAWNIRTPSNRGMIIQKPPGRQNYAIGCFSNVTGQFRFQHPAGFIELTNQALTIPSLYDLQFAQRQAIGPLPDAPARLTASINATSQDITLNWLDIAANETGYEIRLSVGFGGAQDLVIDTVAANVTTYVDVGRGGDYPEYTYQVVALGQNAPSPYSNPATVTSTVSTREASAHEVRIVPNPVIDFLRVETELPVESVSIFNANGQHVATVRDTRSLSTAAWVSGVYYLTLRVRGGRTLSARVVKQ